MTPDAQRIAIAKACGWVNVKLAQTFAVEFADDFPPVPCGNRPGDNRWGPVPRYEEDLNSMHEAVMAQPPGTRLLFRKELQYMIAPRTRPGPVCGIVLMCSEDYDLWFHATAAQRGEAFLRTLDLWKDNE